MGVLVIGGTEFISFHLVTLDWYLKEGLDRREIDFSPEDTLLRRAG